MYVSCPVPKVWINEAHNTWYHWGEREGFDPAGEYLDRNESEFCHANGYLQ